MGMEAAWTFAVEGATGVANSAKHFFLSFRRSPPPPPGPNPIDILKHLQRQAFYDVMQLREKQENFEGVLTLFKTSKSGPFAEESTRVKGIIMSLEASHQKTKRIHHQITQKQILVLVRSLCSRPTSGRRILSYQSLLWIIGACL